MLLLKRQIHLIQGASGSGKTTLLSQALQAWQRGEPFPIEFDAESVAYLVADRNEDQIKGLMKKLGLRMQIYSFIGDPTFPIIHLDHADVLLRKCMEKFTKPYDLLILDPLMPFMQSGNIDYRGVMKGLVPLSRMATSMNIAIIGVAHSTKTRTDFKFTRTQDRISGSMAFQGFSDTQISLVEGAELGESMHLLEIAPHTEARITYRLTRNDEGFFDIIEDKAVVLGKLRGAFIGNFAETAKLIEYAEEESIPRSTLFKWLKKLEGSGNLKKDKRGVYALPEGGGKGEQSESMAQGAA